MARIDRHRGTHRIEGVDIAPGTTGVLAGSTWEVVVSQEALADGSCLVRLGVRCAGGGLEGATVSACLDLPWSRESYLCMPGAVYAGNRFPVRHGGYPPMWEAADCRVDLPTTITDVPRLACVPGESRIDLQSADLTAPAIGVVRPDGVALWLLAAPATPLGLSSLHAEESPGRDRLRLRLCAPGLREDLDYEMSNTRRPSHDRPADFVAGQGIELCVRLLAWNETTIVGLLRRYPDLLLSHGDLGAHVAQLPWSAAFDIQQAKCDGDWNGTYYRLGSGKNPYDDWQAGWVGGGMTTLPLLADGTRTHQARALRNLDWMVSEGQGPVGWFHGIIAQGRLLGDGFGRPGTTTWHLVRKSADVLLFLGKQLLIAERVAPAHPGLPQWREGLRRCADAFYALWRQHRQFGQIVDVQHGGLLVGNSACGAIAPAGLVLAARLLARPELLEIAEAAVVAHHQRWVLAGLSTGGPGEILQCADSESAFALLESAVAVAEVIGSASAWQRAADAAALAATWVFAYDFAFPPESTFGKLDMRSRGSVWANVQNKHSAPAICTLSGDSLLRLARATGDWRWLEILRGIARGLPQYLSRADRPIKDLPPGWMCERVNTSDWERHWCPPGEVFRASCWCEVSLMLTWSELPGVYVRPDLGRCWVLDHVEAVLQADALELSNPTAFPATVRVLVEDAAMAAIPLPVDHLASVPQVLVPAGGSVRVRLAHAAPYVS